VPHALNTFPPGTLVFVRFPVETYLERVAQSAPFAVKEN
jgi:hypothetical protein